MNQKSLPHIAATILVAAFFLGGCATSPGDSGTSSLPEVTHDGLVLIPNTRAGAVWELPDADLSIYKRIAILEPDISFRKNWQSDVNSNRMADRITGSDMNKIIDAGKKFLMEEFTKELEKEGFDVVLETGDDVLVVRPVILNLDIAAPDPNNMNSVWGRTYTDGGGSATLVIELYDSITHQILVRASDSKSDRNRAGNWAMPRSQSANIADARNAFASWAAMLAKGLKNAQAEAERTVQ